ncbi:hypothetical protein CISIN_1g0372212mg, partial [Citrus sinensis]
MLQLAKLPHHHKGFHITFVNFENKKNMASQALDLKHSRIVFYIDHNRAFILFVNQNGNQPAVSCIISDGFMPFTIEAAQQLGLSVVMFLTISACSFMGYKQFRTLKEKGL